VFVFTVSNKGGSVVGGFFFYEVKRREINFFFFGFFFFFWGGGGGGCVTFEFYSNLLPCCRKRNLGQTFVARSTSIITCQLKCNMKLIKKT